MDLKKLIEELEKKERRRRRIGGDRVVLGIGARISRERDVRIDGC